MHTNLFFELLQMALGSRKGLSRVPSAREWEDVYEEAEKQAIDGLLLTGLERLPAEQLPSMDLKLQWIGETQIIEFQNKDMDQKCVELLGMLKKAGLSGTILKGQGIARLYDENLKGRRQPGDIDVYVDCGLEKALAFAQSLGQKDISWDYKHLHLELWEETEVEMHYHVEVLFNLRKNKRLQRWFDNELDELYELNPDTGFVTPSVRFNVFYILLHIYRHFLYEGVGLRQIIDYYFVLKKLSTAPIPKDEDSHYLQAIEQFGMQKFAGGLMWVMQEVMAMPREWMPWEPNEKEGLYILAQVMEGGNFGHYSDKRSRLTGGLGYVTRIVGHSLHLMHRYPSEAFWSPIWVLWHKAWKIGKILTMQLKSGNDAGLHHHR